MSIDKPAQRRDIFLGKRILKSVELGGSFSGEGKKTRWKSLVQTGCPDFLGN